MRQWRETKKRRPRHGPSTSPGEVLGPVTGTSRSHQNARYAASRSGWLSVIEELLNAARTLIEALAKHAGFPSAGPPQPGFPLIGGVGWRVSAHLDEGAQCRGEIFSAQRLQRGRGRAEVRAGDVICVL